MLHVYEGPSEFTHVTSLIVQIPEREEGSLSLLVISVDAYAFLLCIRLSAPLGYRVFAYFKDVSVAK